MMPRGVEHMMARLRPSVVSAVPVAVMPRGVEHPKEVRVDYEALAKVPLAVMPRGVEHEGPDSPSLPPSACPARRDAERR